MGFHCGLKAIPGVVDYLGESYGEKPVLWMEYCENGSLKRYIEGQERALPEEQLVVWYRSMAQTVRLMHAERVVHRVISAENWLVTGNLEVKLSDFGHARRMIVGPDGLTENASLREDNGERINIRTRRIFAEDALRLGRVFYQMASFDLAPVTQSLQPSAVADMCRQRGYSPQIYRFICHLLQLRDRLVIRQAEVGQILRSLEVRELLLDVSGADLEGFYLCSFCQENDAVSQFQCEHCICEACTNRLKRYWGKDQLMCDMCANTVTSKEASRVEEGHFDFTAVDFNSLK